MKKNSLPLRIVFLMALLAVTCAFSLSAADFMVDSICYNIIGDGEVEVTQRDSVKYAGEVFIPETVVNNGTTYRVTCIGNNAFHGCNNLTLVGIPEGVTEIGNNGFAGCTHLENIDLPNSLVKIGNWAFYYCSGFTSFHIPRNLAEIGYDTFQECKNIEFFTCSSLNQHFKVISGVLYNKELTQLVWYPAASPITSFVIPNTVRSLRDYCFGYNTKLVEVILPDSLKWMGMNIFRDCTGITEIDVPDGVQHMGVTVFGNCSNLTRVHLPASLDSIMDCTFMHCNKLSEVTIPRNVSYIDQQAFLMAGVERINIEEGSRLQTIGPNAFFQCTNLKSINIPNTLTTLGEMSFYQCQSLKSVHIGDNLNELGRSVFWECDSLTDAEILGSFSNVRNLFISCPALKRVKIGSKNAPSGITLLDNCAIADCKNIEYLELGSGIDSLRNSALIELVNLKVLICWATVPPRCNDYWDAFSRPTPDQMDAVVYVPKESVEAYREANEWKKFKTIVAIEDVGDVDGNGDIDVADVTELVDQVLAGEIQNPALSDADLDGKVGISDITALIDRILSGN